MLVGRGVFEPAAADALLNEFQAFFKAFFQPRCVEDKVTDFLPVIASVLPPHDADGALKLLAAQP